MLNGLLLMMAVLASDEVEIPTHKGNTIMAEWSARSSSSDTVYGRFHRFDTDLVQKTRDRREGEFYFASQTCGWFRFQGLPLPGTAVPEKIYLFQKDAALVVDPFHRLIEKFAWPIPEGQDFLRAQFLIPGRPNGALLSQYDFILLEETQSTVHLQGRPKALKENRSDEDQPSHREWESIDVLLSKPDMKLTAVCYLNSTCDRETVYTFEQVQINPRNPPSLNLEYLNFTQHDFTAEDKAPPPLLP